MTIDDKRQRLLEHPDTVTLSLLGEEHPWNLGRWGLRLARKAGIDVDNVFSMFDDVDGEDLDFARTLEASSDILVVGLLPFNDDAQDLVDLLSMADLAAVAPQLMEAMSGISDAVEAGDEDEPGKTKAESA